MNSTSSFIYGTVPVVASADIADSIKYYTSVLGFSPDFEFGTPVVYAGVKAGDAEIYFTHDPELIRVTRENKVTPEIFIWINDADELFKIHVANGAEIIEPISDRPWGARQYVIKDINGYYLKFAQPV